MLPGGIATVPTPIGLDREIVGELAVAEERESVAARRFLDPFGDHLSTAGLGTVSKESVSA